MAVIAPDRLYSCSDCGRDDVPWEEMTHVTKNQLGVGSKCLKCNRAYRQAQERRLRATARDDDGNMVEPVSEADPAPARLLVALLRYDRDHGLDFGTAWDEGVQFVLDRIGGPGPVRRREQEGWREVFEHTRAAWQAAWDRQSSGPGSALTPALLDAPSGERAAYERAA